ALCHPMWQWARTALIRAFFAIWNPKAPRRRLIRFTKFGSWRDCAHVEKYINSFVSMNHDDCNEVYKKLHGRFQPVATCLEYVIKGTPVIQSIESVWNAVTKPAGYQKSLYNQLERIANNRHPGFVNERSTLGLFKTIALEYFYGGVSHLFTDKNDLEIAEYGLGCLGTAYDNDAINAERVSETSKKILVAYVNEPMVFETLTLHNYFKNTLEQGILELMSIVRDDSMIGKMWEKYIPAELMCMFDGKKIVSQLPVFEGFQGRPEIPDIYHQTATVIQPLNYYPLVKESTDDYINRIMALLLKLVMA
ncbi:2258_t:CDS:2, partial [Paraglomus occultum]